MKIVVFFFYIMSSMVIHAAPAVSDSLPVRRMIAIEKLANEAQAQLEHSGWDDKVRVELEKRFLSEIAAHIDDIVEPKFLYTLAIILNEGYAEEFLGTLHDRLMWQAGDHVVMRLAQLGTEEAYNYFMRLKPYYGRDAGESVKYRVLEFRYLKKYSKDPRVLRAKSFKDFI